RAPTECDGRLSAGPLADPDPHVVFGVRPRRLLEMDRWLARDRHRLDREADLLALGIDDRLFAPGLQRSPRRLPREALERLVEHVALDEAAPDGFGGVDDQRVGLAQRQETEGVVEVAVGEED